jgi:hypothetical protein
MGLAPVTGRERQAPIADGRGPPAQSPGEGPASSAVCKPSAYSSCPNSRQRQPAGRYTCSMTERIRAAGFAAVSRRADAR